ncbi:hypothetical protein [Paraflavitalea speifideaquila]|uniref:hypothetical protein n=1 Tax=Paraflavitalea speifideaquila TaxID=3076558 RepID=UPI0028F0A48B|nr:hypothetical protein [Paraflavitalea speifideiaquila]
MIAYEGIIKQSGFEQYKHLKAPVAQGDGPLWVANKNPQESQFSVYGSGHVGIFGSIIRTTNVKGILQLNLLATDFFHEKAYPSYLYYNPYTSPKIITIQTKKGEKTDLYNTITGKFLAQNVTGSTTLTIPARSAAVIVHTPAGGQQTTVGNKLLVDGVIVDYRVR